MVTVAPPLLPARASVDGTHRRLLEESLLLFGERGFHGVSVREIAQAAGIRASSRYAHIESKEQLLLELMLIGYQEHHEALSSALLDSGDDPVDQIRRLVAAHVRLHAEFPLLARVCNRELAALAAGSRQVVMAVRNESEQLFFRVIERGMRRGQFDVADPWLAVAALGAIGIRVAEWWSAQLDYSVDDVVEAYSTFAVRMLGAEPIPRGDQTAAST